MTPMPIDDNIMLFSQKFHIHSYHFYHDVYCSIKAMLYIMMWWTVVMIVCSALLFNYICKTLCIFQLESHAIYIMICKNMANILTYFENTSIENCSRTRIIMDQVNNTPYLLRHYLFLKNRKTFPFNIFIHKFIKGDEDDIHDHPWGFFHIILSGGYWEHITVNNDGETLSNGIKKVWRPPGHWNIATHKYKHKIELGSEKPWTIFIPFRKLSTIEPWGFWVPNKDGDNKNTTWKKINHVTYLENKRKNK